MGFPDFVRFSAVISCLFDIPKMICSFDIPRMKAPLLNVIS